MSIGSIHQDWWKSFCRQWGKSEDEMKSLLFQGELNKKEYEKLINCAQFCDNTYPDEEEENQRFIYCILYNKLFASYPQLIERCNWNMLDTASWELLLAKHPQFADKCDKWDEFKGHLNL